MKTVCFDWHIERQENLEPLIEAAIEQTFEYEGVDFSASVEALLVDSAEIREMNLAYRGIDRVTDVLSFPLYNNKEEAQADRLSQQPVLLGNMVLCLPRAEEQAAEYGHSLKREVAFLSVHSALHLLGYDHELGEREETDMFRRQREIMDKLGIARE